MVGTIATRMYVRAACIGVLAAVGTAAIIGISTDVIANPWFIRKTPVRWFDVAVLAALSVLTGALVFTYAFATGPTNASRRVGIGSGVVGWFAIGCPVCNKVVVALLGTSGALGTFAPLQPFLGALAVLLAGLALAVRVRAIRRGMCPIRAPRPVRTD